MVFRILNKLKYLFFDIHNAWEVGFIPVSIEEIVEHKITPKIQWFKTPKNTIWADPFGIKVKDKYYIFYEEKKKGEYGIVNCMVLDSKFKILANKTIIDEKVHFSFPQVILQDNAYYMLPETYSKDRLSLYVCEGFPWKWKEETILLNTPCVDSILHYQDNLWHLFYCKIGHGNNLFLRVNDQLKTGWEETSETLINQNPFNSQNAGQLLNIQDKTYRFSQNCSKIYGESIVINQVNDISPDNYDETIYHEISLKSKTVSCCHTLNSCGDITLIDRRRERHYLKSPIKIIKSLLTKFRSI
jgi:hypothetical protein